MSQRIEKINELLRQKLSESIIKELEFPPNTFVTITKVETTPDLKYAKIFITVLPDNSRGTALEILRKNSHHLYKILQKKLMTKFTPNLNFLIDEQELYAQDIDKLLDEINKE
jgi:ribosome-binding factor A